MPFQDSERGKTGSFPPGKNCPECGGKGWVPFKETVGVKGGKYAHRTIKIDCYRCKGTGIVPEKVELISAEEATEKLVGLFIESHEFQEEHREIITNSFRQCQTNTVDVCIHICRRRNLKIMRDGVALKEIIEEMEKLKCRK